MINPCRLFCGASIIILISFASCRTQSSASADSTGSLTHWVDPYIGTGGHGHVFLGANVPFGAVQLGPTNLSEGWDWCSGYNYSDSTIIGFSHTHLSGTGVGDLGDISVMPVTGIVTMEKGLLNKPGSGFYSLFSHSEEIAKPGFYSVHLKRYDIQCSLTATERVGFHKYHFPNADSGRVIIDLENGIGWDLATSASIEQVNDSTITGYRYSTGWAHDQRIFFAAVFSKPIKKFIAYDSSSLLSTSPAIGKKIKAVVIPAAGNELLIKLGISPVSVSNALDNIKAELPGWDFDATVQQADAAWNHELGRIRIQSADSSRMRIFYTALYHTMIAPSLFNDHNGDYLGTDKKVYNKAPFQNLTTFSLWDTYRGAHPLYTVFQPDRVNDMINSMLAIYQQQGKLPVWHLMGNETNTMPGYSSVQVVADAYLKGFRGFDTSLAWEAVKATAMQDERGLKFVKKYGFIPADTMNESVALGLEYAIADWGIAQMAKKMGKQDDFEYFSKRANNYKNYFDPSGNFMRGRISENSWRIPFDPFAGGGDKHDYAEGNAWQYTWLVPEDVDGLVQLFHGKEQFISKLDSFFVLKGDLGSEAPPDISGLIGQYAHGNEPSHHIAYLYDYVNQPWKTAEKVRYILDSLYTTHNDGLSGNEDVGQMSAWYVLSALGIYQVNPSDGIFALGSPVIDDAEIKLPGDKVFHIRVTKNSAANKYIQQAKLNGIDRNTPFISYQEIMQGGEMEIEMGPNPSKSWGTGSK